MSPSTAAKRPFVVDPSTKLKALNLADFITRLLSNHQSRVAESVKDLIAKGDYKGLVSLTVAPSNYADPDLFAADYLLASVVKKYQDFNLGIDREQAAFEKWLASEESCSRTNHFFRDFLSGRSSPFPHRVTEIFHLAQRKIGKILGKVDYSLIRSYCRFGPGSDLSTYADETSAYNKFSSSGSATPYVSSLYSEIFSEDWRENYLHNCDHVDGSRLSFVPKSAVIDRAICVEPRWNIYLQLGIGGLISQRLSDEGLDLKDQNRNRTLARLAHVYNLATIDLSSASDTVSKNLVLYLLPDEWSDLIFKSRSPTTTYRGSKFLLEKVSSMGNGYTFPLESLIFYALCWAVCTALDVAPCIGTYGDDLIVPQEVVRDLVEVLSYAGFSVNTDKTFVSGDFFESCGSDYFKGCNVRPFFIKKKVSAVLDYITLANQITEYMRRLPGVSKYLDLRFARDYVVSHIPKTARLKGPVGLNGVIHSSFDECRPKHALHGWEGWLIRAWVPIPVKRLGHSSEGHLYSKISADVMTGQGFIPRAQVRWKKKEIYVPSFCEFLWVEKPEAIQA